MFVKNNILGVEVTSEKQDTILEYIDDNIEKKDFRLTIVTPNPEMVVYATKHKQFRALLNKADIALCDGVGLTLAGRLVARPFKERITGVDFMKNLCEKIAKKPVTVGFLGGRAKVAEDTAKCLREIYPSLKVVYTASEFDRSTFPKEGVDILFVAFGFPKQEEWVSTYFDTVSVKIAMGVGGSFDYISGRVSRAPLVIRSVGLEWLYRLVRQPWRLKRQLALLTFMRLVFQDMLHIKG